MSQGRVFIPATLDDNPYLDRAQYVKSLSNLDPVTRQQLLKGDWSARTAGTKFRREWFKIVDAAPADCQWVRYWDMAGTERSTKNADPDWTAGCLMGKTSEGNFYIKDMRHVRLSAQGTDALTKQVAELDGTGITIFFEQEPGESGKRAVDYHIRRLAGWSVYGDRKTGDKELLANPVSSQAEAGNICLVRGTWIGDFLDEVEGFPNGSHDDQVDAMSGAFAKLAVPQSTIEIW